MWNECPVCGGRLSTNLYDGGEYPKPSAKGAERWRVMDRNNRLPAMVVLFSITFTASLVVFTLDRDYAWFLLAWSAVQFWVIKELYM